MSKPKRIAVFIDGSNFYFKLRTLDLEFSSLTEFDYHAFSEWLSRGQQLVMKRYFIGQIKATEDNPKGMNLQKEQELFFEHLESPSQGFVVKKGFLMRKGTTYQEKGVDVQLAIDLLVGAYEDLYDVAILVSSDTDLIPAIKQVKQLGKDVEYLGSSIEPSHALQNEVTMTRLIRKQDIEGFFTKKAVPATPRPQSVAPKRISRKAPSSSRSTKPKQRSIRVPTPKPKPAKPQKPQGKRIPPPKVRTAKPAKPQGKRIPPPTVRTAKPMGKRIPPPKLRPQPSRPSNSRSRPTRKLK